MTNDELIAEWKRLEDAFHDSLPDQGDPGDPAAGKALCQFLYDNSPHIRAALQSRADDVEREAAFLCARLREFESVCDQDACVREYSGHVAPSLARLESLLAALGASDA